MSANQTKKSTSECHGVCAAQLLNREAQTTTTTVHKHITINAYKNRSIFTSLQTRAHALATSCRIATNYAVDNCTLQELIGLIVRAVVLY